jgi:hypothetical protein
MRRGRGREGGELLRIQDEKGDEKMNEAVVIVRESDGLQADGPLPLVAPTDFTVVIGAVLAGGTEREMREELKALGGLEEGYASLVNVLEWVEDVFSRCREVREDGGRLRGQVMGLGAAMVGTYLLRL